MQPREKLRGLEPLLLGEVAIFHPGYDRAVVTSPAHDPIDPPPHPPQPPQTPHPPHSPQPTGQHEGGIAHRVVLDACHIIAGNQECFLASDITGDKPIATDVATLSAGIYYLHLRDKPGSTNKYPIVAEFAAWTPPKSVPVHWDPMAKDSRRRLQLRARYARSASLMSEAVKEQDKHCIITEFSRSIQNAHVLPRDQSAWFELHSMDLYCHNPQALIDDTANGLALRSDVLECFDRCSFVFFPLDASTYLAYIVGGSESHYVELLHRRPVAMPERVSEFFLYARFAYNILAHVRPWWTKYGATIPFKRFQVKGAMTEAKDHAGPRAYIVLSAVLSPSAASRSVHPSETSSSSESLSDVQTLEKEERWTARWKARFSDLNEESVDPPDTRIFSHPDSLRIRRLADAYMAKNPQISMSSSGSRLHDDGSALYAED